MGQLQIAGCHRRKFVVTTKRDTKARPAPDLVERNFTAPAPHRVWVADIERHEALTNRAVMKGHRLEPVAAG
jgi:putative transposase